MGNHAHRIYQRSIDIAIACFIVIITGFITTGLHMVVSHSHPSHTFEFRVEEQ